MITFDKTKEFLVALFERLKREMCFWCCCRHIGVGDISFYKQSVQSGIDEFISWYPNCKEVVSSCVDSYGEVCSACYGVLTDFATEEFLDQIKYEVVKQGFEYEHFCCSLALPISSILRDYTFLLICSDICSEAYQYMPLEQIPSVKDVWKWMCGAKLEKRLGKRFCLEHLDILIDFEQEEMKAECDFLTEKFRDHFKKRKNSRHDMFTRNNVLQALQSVSRDKLKSLVPYPPKKLSHKATLKSILCTHNPVYIAGRYNKYSRELSQSPWMIEGERKGDTSVSELLTEPIMNYTRADSNNFSSSGREDIDVRMLGSGRPFMIQLLNPRRVLDQQLLNNLQEEINIKSPDLISVHSLQLVTREDCDRLKDLETEKRKTYSALCLSDSPMTQQELDALQSVKDLVLDQITPIRVLHRRALATRPKTVHWLKAELDPNDNRLFTLTIETQGGTYIKEFVHSDFGRTTPHLGTLLGDRQMDIMTLDVLSVHVDWPPATADSDKTETNKTGPVTQQTDDMVS